MAVSLIAVTLSAGIVGYTLARLNDVERLERKVEILDVRYANLQADVDDIKGN